VTRCRVARIRATVLEGEVDLRSNERVIHAKPGTFVFATPGVRHAITNSGNNRARILIGCIPPGHENYFDELAALLAKGGPPDAAMAALRKRYDTIQLSGMQFQGAAHDLDPAILVRVQARSQLLQLLRISARSYIS
jgi:hypothetical protein